LQRCNKNYNFEYLESSSLATVLMCVSSGPSAILKHLAQEYALANPKSADNPPAL